MRFAGKVVWRGWHRRIGSAMPGAHFAPSPKPEDIARVILFLASDDAKVIHGAAIPVYGNGGNRARVPVVEVVYPCGMGSLQSDGFLGYCRKAPAGVSPKSSGPTRNPKKNRKWSSSRSQGSLHPSQRPVICFSVFHDGRRRIAIAGDLVDGPRSSSNYLADHLH